MTEIQFDSIFSLAYKNAQKSKNISEYNHFIKYFNENKYTTIAVKELDTLQFHLYESYNSMDSLYKFKTRFINSKLLSETDELIVSMKIKLCKYKPSIECFESIIKEFPKCRRALVIQTEINIIQDSIASNDFTKCKSQKSIECLVQIKRKYPKASIIKEVNDEIDNLNYSNYVSSMRLDSIALFLTNFVNSKKILDAQQSFTKIFEDSIKTISVLRENEYYLLNYQELKNSFFPLVQLYYSFNNNNSQIKESIEDFVYMSIKDEGGIEGLNWFINEFPYSSKINIAKAEIKNQKSNNNIAFIAEVFEDEYSKQYVKSKYGLLNMTNASFKFGYFFEDIKSFESGLAAVKLFGKWGFINLQGDVEIPFLFDDVKSFNAPVTGVCQEGVWFLIDKTGFRVSDKEYLKIGDFGNGIVNVQPYTGGWQYINEIEEVVSPRTYFNATNFINGLAAVSTKNSEVLIIDQSFNILNDITLCLDKKSGYYGEYGSSTRNIESFEYCDTRQEYVINSFLYYDKYTNTCNAGYYPKASYYSENLLTFDLTGTYLLDGRGIIYYNGTYQSSNFSSREYSLELGEGHYFGYTIRNNDITVYRQLFSLESLPINDFTEVPTRYVGVDFKLNFNIAHELVEERYSELLGSYQVMPFKLISFNKDFAVISKELGQGIITKSGTLINNVCSFESITPIMDGMCIVGSKPGYFLMDENGEKQSALYSSIKRLNSELFIVSEKGNPKSYLINKNEQVLSDYYDIIESKIISNTILVSNSNGNKKVHGLIDINGKVLVPLIYDDVFCTYGNLVFGKCPNGNNRACNFDIYNYSGKKIKTLIDYLRYGFIDSSGLKFFKGHYSKVNTNGERKVIIDDEYLLPNFK
jgi:hypothetical protein